MRILNASAAAGLLLAGMTSANAQPATTYDARAFFALNFGGATPTHDLHYGLRLDPSLQTTEHVMAPRMELDLSRAPGAGLRLNGVYLARTVLATRQNDTGQQPAPPADAQQPPPADNSAPQPAGAQPPATPPPAEPQAAAPPPAPAEEPKPQSHGFLGLEWGDWVTLTVALAALGYIGNEVIAKGKDSADPKVIFGVFNHGGTSASFAGSILTDDGESGSVDWQNEGTGFMGDLLARR